MSELDNFFDYFPVPLGYISSISISSYHNGPKTCSGHSQYTISKLKDDGVEGRGLGYMSVCHGEVEVIVHMNKAESAEIKKRFDVMYPGWDRNGSQSMSIITWHEYFFDMFNEDDIRALKDEWAEIFSEDVREFARWKKYRVL